MNSFTQPDVLAACSKYGPQLNVDGIEYLRPDGAVQSVSGAALMLAIAAVETGGGQVDYAGHDCGPRHEPAYDEGGKFWKTSNSLQLLIGEYGSQAAMSYGPWQMMFDNFTLGEFHTFVPSSLTTDLEFLAVNFVNFFNHYVLHFHPTSVVEVGEIWNAGHITSDPAYTDKLMDAYSVALSLYP